MMMRKKLIRYVKRRFGPVIGSAGMKEAREKMTRAALERYDEAAANGADEKAAYEAAADSIGDLNELFDSLNVRERRRRLRIVIAAAIFTAFLLVYAIAALIRGGLSGMLSLLSSFTLPLGAAAFGVISLLAGIRRKALSIVSIVIGGYLLMMQVFSFPAISPGQEHYKFDFTADMDNIASVETVTVSELDYSDGRLYEDGLVYSVERSFAPSEWEAVLAGAAKLDYTYRDINAKKLNSQRGKTMLLIRLRGPESGLSFVLLGRYCPCFGELSEKGVMIRESCYYTSSRSWNDFVGSFPEGER